MNIWPPSIHEFSVKVVELYSNSNILLSYLMVYKSNIDGDMTLM